MKLVRVCMFEVLSLLSVFRTVFFGMFSCCFDRSCVQQSTLQLLVLSSLVQYQQKSSLLDKWNLFAISVYQFFQATPQRSLSSVSH